MKAVIKRILRESISQALIDKHFMKYANKRVEVQPDEIVSPTTGERFDIWGWFRVGNIYAENGNMVIEIPKWRVSAEDKENVDIPYDPDYDDEPLCTPDSGLGKLIITKTFNLRYFIGGKDSKKMVLIKSVFEKESVEFYI
jgi:hypothetical protein